MYLCLQSYINVYKQKDTHLYMCVKKQTHLCLCYIHAHILSLFRTAIPVSTLMYKYMKITYTCVSVHIHKDQYTYTAIQRYGNIEMSRYIDTSTDVCAYIQIKNTFMCILTYTYIYASIHLCKYRSVCPYHG